MSRCTLHGGAFLVQRTTFWEQRAMFLRPLDEGRPQSAKKVSALDAFGSPAASLSGPKVWRNRLGSPKMIQKSGKGDPKIDVKKYAGKNNQMYTKKPSTMMPKRIPKSPNSYTFAKKAEMLQTVCFPIEDVVLGIQQFRKVHQKWMQNPCLKKACKK